MDTDDIVRVLTASALTGLLFTVGLRLRIDRVIEALKRSPLGRILIVNFGVVPALTVAAVRLGQLEPAVATAMILLAAAPFAPVVPVFARLAQADLALAAGLTSVIPLVSVFLTPFVCLLCLQALPSLGEVRLSAGVVLLTLLGTMFLPLASGIGLNHWRPVLSRRILRPIEIVAEGAGALSLAFVTITQFRSISTTDWRALLIMVVLFELFLWLGYLSGGTSLQARRVVALGTSNRNIALALLVALQSYPGTPVVPGVVANGFLLILLGLVQVGWWRFRADRRQ